MGRGGLVDRTYVSCISMCGVLQDEDNGVMWLGFLARRGGTEGVPGTSGIQQPRLPTDSRHLALQPQDEAGDRGPQTRLW